MVATLPHEDSCPSFSIEAAPISWAPSQEPTEVDANVASKDDRKVFTLSEEVQDFIADKIDHLSKEGEAELGRYEEFSKAFIARERALKTAVAPSKSHDRTGIQSITPKVQLHKVRVKKPSQFMQSPFESLIKVTSDQEEVYQKIMLSSKHMSPSISNLKKYQIIKYKDSWAITSDLADSIHVRGELSNHCMEVGLEYLRRTNKVDGKLIVPFQISSFLIGKMFTKKLVFHFSKGLLFIRLV